MWSIVSHTQVLILQKQQYSSIAPSCKYYLTWGTVLAQLRKYSFEQPDVLYSFKHLKSAIGTMLGICKLMSLTMHNWLYYGQNSFDCEKLKPKSLDGTYTSWRFAKPQISSTGNGPVKSLLPMYLQYTQQIWTFEAVNLEAMSLKLTTP